MKIKILVVFGLLSFFSAKAQQQGPPPAIKPGLEIDRDVLIKKVVNFDTSMVFNKNEDLNNLPN